MHWTTKITIIFLTICIGGLVALFAYETLKPPPPTPQEELRTLQVKADHRDKTALREICDHHPEVITFDYHYCILAAQAGDEKAVEIIREQIHKLDCDPDYNKKGLAEQGDSTAQFNKGFGKYFGGCGHGAASYEEAYFWLSLALKNGKPPEDQIDYAFWRNDAAKHLTLEELSLENKSVESWKPTPAPAVAAPAGHVP